MPRKSQEIRLPFNQTALTPAENLALYPLVARGDAAAREKMILGNMALVASKVRSYLNQFSGCNYLKDDLLSQGFVGLVKGVNAMVGEEQPNPNPTGVMSKYIHYELGELLDYESTIRIPQRTFLRKKSNGDDITVPTKEASLTSHHTFEREAVQDPRTMTDLWDELMGCCENDTEQAIVKHRSEGRKDDEIASMLGLPKTTTYMMRRGIYARFLERNPEVKGEV
jgi:hypothetical protein